MEPQIISLYELNNLIRGTISETFYQRFWIRAETSDVRINQNGHCYLEFIEKDINNKKIVARTRGSIWANVFKLLKTYFESESGQQFTSGINVLVQVSVEFHELYGFSLNVHNIDPTYTVGDQAKRRALIIKQLEEEGVLTLNKELELATICNRIAIISSPTAAGYEDFCDQLDNNVAGFVFYTHLFPAIMQGERTEESIIFALDRIYNNIEKFDVVVIIRGGGATSELSSFDSYLLATNCAQFPLPIITGIGHERDDTVLDLVAHTRAKTPTAVAEFLVYKMELVNSYLSNIQNILISSIKETFIEERTSLNILSTRFSYITREMNKDQINILNAKKDKLVHLAKQVVTSKNTSLDLIVNKLPHVVGNKLKIKYSELENYKPRLLSLTSLLIVEKKNFIKNTDLYLKLISPENILKKGYTLTLKDNKIVKSINEITSGDKLVNRFQDGEVKSVVE